MAKEPVKIVVEVSGGVVVAVYADRPRELSVSICDHDNARDDGNEWQEDFLVQPLSDFEA